ncbi:MAG: tRNA lysidine(34) synthetase TilS [Candidatus Nanopelagicales bacterium]|nr:tRNA lysidine(34) synthetase TilS [Candidatus Nanopelagicales bacterium]MDP4906893.1 tRNA lysidine(34) synthetase TilS [Candidatus Nanopelagicales bacterium]MDP4974379.1 tRNA lysidine(34) synthetase TilS [Candidatus Nanopelagicales bacterium]
MDHANAADAQRIVRRAVAGGLADLPSDAMVVVAVSGGADSLALARGVASLNRRAVAAVIDHGLQDGSPDIAVTAAETCVRLGLADVVVERVAVSAKGVGPEAAAREARRDILEQIANRWGASAILLGHTLDDQAETVLLRLARGSGARSLAAMAPVTGLWRRPLLGVPRAIVRTSVEDVPIWDDPHNSDPTYTRVRVRLGALPALADALGPDVIASLARTARQLRDDADALDDQARIALGQCRTCDEHVDGIESLDVTAVASLPRAIRTRVMRQAALLAGCPAEALSAAHIDRVDSLIADWRGQGGVDLPGGVVGERRYGRLTFARATPVAERRRREGEV